MIKFPISSFQFSRWSFAGRDPNRKLSAGQISKLYKSGFTLLELIIVITVIGVLATATFGMAATQTTKARDAQRLENIKEIKNALDVYYHDHDYYPDYSAGSPFKLAFDSGQQWSENGTIYMKKVPIDPVTNAHFDYKVDPSAKPQWAVVFAKLTNTPNTAMCNLPSFTTSNSGCVPSDFSSSTGCVISGSVNCGEPPPAPTSPVSQPGVTLAPTPTSAPAGNTALVKDADHDRYYTGSPGPQIVLGNQQDPTSLKTYYRTTTSGASYSYLAQSDALGGGDCDDNNSILYYSLISSVIDADRDGYYSLSSSPSTNCVGSSSPYTVSGGLVGSYNMDAGTGTSVADSSGFNNNAKFGSMFGLSGWWKMAGVTDSSGNGLNINYGTGNPTTGPLYGANSTSAIAFNGTSDYIAILDNPLLNPTRQLTVSGWFKLNTLTAGYQTLFFKGNAGDCTSGCENRQYAMWVDSGGTLVVASTSSDHTGPSGVQSVCVGVAGSIVPGKWYYAALVINSDTNPGTISIYLNGVLQNQSNPTVPLNCSYYATSPNGIRTTTGNLYIGGNPTYGVNSGPAWLNGTVADFKVYSRALSGFEIQQSYSTATNGLVGYWQLDENSGSSTNDASGYGNVGTLKDTGLIGYWKLDEASGNVADSSIYNYPGYATGTTSVAGKWNNARNFNGTSDYISAAPAIGATATFSTWATWTGADAHMLFGLGSGSPGPDVFFYQGKIAWNTYDGVTDSFANIPANANDGNFHHYVFVIQNGNTKLYYDGALLGTAPTYKNPTSNVLQIGGHAGYFWAGKIDEFRVYNRALTDTEITTLYQQNYSASWIQPGRIGASALNFNGNQYVTSNAATPAGDSPWSIALWVKTTANPATGWATVIALGTLGSGSYTPVIYRSPGGWYAAGFYSGATAAAVTGTGTWDHLVVTYPGGGGLVTVYKNGVPSQSTSSQSAFGLGNSNGVGVTLGSDYWGPSMLFNGQIDDVQVYNRVLTQTEVTAILNNSGSPTWVPDRNGVAGKALLFNGKTGFAGIGTPVSLNTNGDMSISGWVNTSGSAVANQSIATWANGAFTTFPYHFVITTLNQLRLNDGTIATDSVNTVPLNTWTHVAMTISGNQLRYYINNVPDSANPRTINTRNIGNGYLTLSREASGAQSFGGSMDDIKFYKRALSATEISELYSTSIPGMIANWKFDETSGTTATDSVGGFNATMGSSDTFQAGKIGNSLYNTGNGAGAVAPVGAGSALDFTPASRPTISFWLKVNSLSSSSRLFGRFGCGGWDVWYSLDGTMVLETSCGNQIAWGSMVTADNQWHHYAVTYNGGSASLYKDGSLVSTLSYTPTWTSSSIPINIGGDSLFPLRGYMDEVQIYNRPLTSGEISVLASQSPSGGLTKNYYKNSSGSNVFIKSAETNGTENAATDNDPSVP